MRIFNPDGSEAEMCGNALRCVGKYLYETGAVRSDCMSVETLGGVKPLRVSVQNGRVTSVAADMGEAKLGETVKIDLGGRETAFLTVDMGNPHAVTYDLFPGDVEFEHFGPCVERHPHFPKRTNVEFCRALTPTRADVRVWERGAGRRWPAAPALRRLSRRACTWAICGKRRKWTCPAGGCCSSSARAATSSSAARRRSASLGNCGGVNNGACPANGR